MTHCTWGVDGIYELLSSVSVNSFKFFLYETISTFHPRTGHFLPIPFVGNWFGGNGTVSTIFRNDTLTKWQVALDASPEMTGGTSRKAGSIRRFLR